MPVDELAREKANNIEKIVIDEKRRLNGNLERLWIGKEEDKKENVGQHKEIIKEVKEIKDAIDAKFENSISKKDAFRERIYTAVITAMIVYVIFEKLLGK